MVDFYEIEIAGVKRKLPLMAVGKKTKLAQFNIVGDVELVEKVSDALVAKLKKFQFDFLVGPEVKVVPLIHELAKKLGQKHYIICRKSVKPYMVSPIILKPLPYFPRHIKPLVIDSRDAAILKGKKVAIVDDVVSTGVTMRMINKLMEKIGAEVVVNAALIRQGKEQFDEIKNFIYLTELPIFKST